MALGYAETVEYLEGFELFLASTIARQAWGDHVCLAKFIPTPNGSPETLVDDGVDAGAKVTGAWCAQLVKALEPAHTQAAILSVLSRFETGFRLEDFAKVAADKFLRGTMLGALDSQWERDNEEVLQPIHFALNPPPLNVTGGTFNEVIKHWDSQDVLTRPAFDALQEGTKRKAFTVARMASGELLDATHAELRRQIELGRTGGQTEGLALRDFHKFAAKRLESAGWTPASPSHVETIFRTNVISAYSSGRFTEMRQPAVMAALPYWQILAVRDPRTRETHKAASGTVLRADDAFWKHAYPPFGYNCRCKVCARTKAWLERNAKSVGPTPHGLPDPGFDSGTKTLIAVPDAALKQAPDAPAPVAAPPARPPGLGPPSPFPDVSPFAPTGNTPSIAAPLPAPTLPALGPPSPFGGYAPPIEARPVPIAPETFPELKRPEPPPSLKAPSPFPAVAPLNPVARKISDATGSNPGGVYEGSDGVKRYVKFYRDPAQSVGEHLANSLYTDLGLGGLKSQTFEHAGSLAYASEIIPNQGTIGKNLTKALAKKALDGFAADVLMANWDAAGPDLANMLVTEGGGVIRVDNGAAFLTRAQGARKPLSALEHVTEWESLFDPSKNPGYAKLAAKAGVKGPADLAASIKKSVAKIKKLSEAPGGWTRYVAERAQGMRTSDQQQIVDMLEARTEFLEKKVAEFPKWVACGARRSRKNRTL